MINSAVQSWQETFDELYSTHPAFVKVKHLRDLLNRQQFIQFVAELASTIDTLDSLYLDMVKARRKLFSRDMTGPLGCKGINIEGTLVEEINWSKNELDYAVKTKAQMPVVAKKQAVKRKRIYMEEEEEDNDRRTVRASRHVEQSENEDEEQPDHGEDENDDGDNDPDSGNMMDGGVEDADDADVVMDEDNNEDEDEH